RRRRGAVSHDRLTRFSKNKTDDKTAADEADELDEHVACRVNAWEAVPVRIGNVGRDGREYPGDHDEADASAETTQTGLGQKEDDKDGYEKFGGEFDSQPFDHGQRASRRMIHENAG